MGSSLSFAVSVVSELPAEPELPEESEYEKVTTLVEKLYKFVDCQIIKSSYFSKGEAWLKFFSSKTMIRSDLKEIEKTIKKISRNYNLEL